MSWLAKLIQDLKRHLRQVAPAPTGARQTADKERLRSAVLTEACPGMQVPPKQFCVALCDVEQTRGTESRDLESRGQELPDTRTHGGPSGRQLV